MQGGSVINPKDVEVLVEASLVPRSFLVGGYVEACVVGYLAMLIINTNTAAILVLNIKITLRACMSSVFPDGTTVTWSPEPTIPNNKKAEGL